MKTKVKTTVENCMPFTKFSFLLAVLIFASCVSKAGESAAPQSGGDSSEAPGIKATTYSISGSIGGEKIAGITMSLTGDATETKTTDNSGNFSFAGLDKGNYTLTPSFVGYTFTPDKIALTVSGTDINGLFFSSKTTTYSIVGKITGPGRSGASIVATGIVSGNATTSADGSYSIGGLKNGSYTVTPTLNQCTFSPANSKS